MNKKLIALSVMAAATTMAHAQSSVTLYGRIDNGVQYETGLPGGNKFSAQSGDWGCSWFGWHSPRCHPRLPRFPNSAMSPSRLGFQFRTFLLPKSTTSSNP